MNFMSICCIYFHLWTILFISIYLKWMFMSRCSSILFRYIQYISDLCQIDEHQIRLNFALYHCFYCTEHFSFQKDSNEHGSLCLWIYDSHSLHHLIHSTVELHFTYCEIKHIVHIYHSNILLAIFKEKYIISHFFGILIPYTVWMYDFFLRKLRKFHNDLTDSTAKQTAQIRIELNNHSNNLIKYVAHSSVRLQHLRIIPLPIFHCSIIFVPLCAQMPEVLHKSCVAF